MRNFLIVGSRRNRTSEHDNGGQPAGRAGHYDGRHLTASRRPARTWAGKAVPAAAIAATLAAGTAAYGLTGTSQAVDPARLTAALSSPVILHAITQSDAVRADAAAAILLSPRHAARFRAHGGSAARPGGSAAPPGGSAAPSGGSATAQPSAAAAPAIASQPARTPAAAATTPAPSPSASASHPAAGPTVSCSNNSYLLPENVTAIVGFLLAHGYSDNAVAGIAGNMYQESKGDPESVGMGGGGLIGFTPLPSGYVTGNPAADLQTQLNAVLSYNQGWASYLPQLNSAASPADAAYIYVTDFERAGIPAASTREASAQAVASACNI